MTLKYDKNDYFNGAVGITAGYATYKYVPKWVTKPCRKILKDIKNIPHETNDTYWNAAQRAFTDNGLDKKGIKVVDFNEKNLETTLNNLLKKAGLTNGGNKLEKYLKKRRANKLKKHLDAAAAGNNACYVPLTKEVLVNKEKMSFATFHELGHSINHTSHGFKNFLAKIRGKFALAIPATLAIGLIERPNKSNTDGHKQTAGEFIKKHCGLIAGLCMVPVVAEEGLASLNGQKMAKNVLDNKSYKKLVNLNTKAFSTYVLSAVVVGLCTQLAVFVKDKITGDK